MVWLSLIGGFFISIAGLLLVCMKNQLFPWLYIAALGSLFLITGTNLRIKNKMSATFNAGKIYRTCMESAPDPYAKQYLTQCAPGGALTIRWSPLTPYRLAVYAANKEGQEFVLGYLQNKIGKYLCQYFACDENMTAQAEIIDITGGKVKQCLIGIKPLPDRHAPA